MLYDRLLTMPLIGFLSHLGSKPLTVITRSYVYSIRATGRSYLSHLSPRGLCWALPLYSFRRSNILVAPIRAGLWHAIPPDPPRPARDSFCLVGDATQWSRRRRHYPSRRALSSQSQMSDIRHWPTQSLFNATPVSRNLPVARW